MKCGYSFAVLMICALPLSAMNKGRGGDNYEYENEIYAARITHNGKDVEGDYFIADASGKIRWSAYMVDSQTETEPVLCVPDVLRPKLLYRDYLCVTPALIGAAAWCSSSHAWVSRTIGVITGKHLALSAMISLALFGASGFGRLQAYRRDQDQARRKAAEAYAQALGQWNRQKITERVKNYVQDRPDNLYPNLWKAFFGKPADRKPFMKIVLSNTQLVYDHDKLQVYRWSNLYYTQSEAYPGNKIYAGMPRKKGPYVGVEPGKGGVKWVFQLSSLSTT